MYEVVNFSRFKDAFDGMGRGESWSYEGLKTLYDYLMEEEESTGISEELDVIELDGTFAEYDSFEEFQADNNEGFESLDSLRDKTIVIDIARGGFIIQEF